MSDRARRHVIRTLPPALEKDWALDNRF